MENKYIILILGILLVGNISAMSTTYGDMDITGYVNYPNQLTRMNDVGYVYISGNSTLENSTRFGIDEENGYGIIEAFINSTWTPWSFMTGANSSWSSSGSDLYYNDGSVGIGGVSSTELLGVIGTNPQIILWESDSEFLRMGVETTGNDMVIGWDDGDDLSFGVYANPADSYVWEHMTIKGTGDVGIGIQIPDARLHVVDSWIGADFTTNHILGLEDAGNAYLGIVSGTAYYAGITFGDNADVDTGRILYSNTDNSMRFYTSGVEKMRLRSGGDLYMGSGDLEVMSGSIGVGTASPQDGIHLLDKGIRFESTADSLWWKIYYSDSTNALRVQLDGDTVTQWFKDTSVPSAPFRFTPGISGGYTYLGDSDFRWKKVYSTQADSISSDIRLKENIKDLSLGVDFINKLRPISYTRINESFNKTNFGFSAQQVEQVIFSEGRHNTELIDYDLKSDSYGMGYTELIAPIVKAIQELKMENDLLKYELCIKDNSYSWC